MDVWDVKCPCGKELRYKKQDEKVRWEEDERYGEAQRWWRYFVVVCPDCGKEIRTN